MESVIVPILYEKTSKHETRKTKKAFVLIFSVPNFLRKENMRVFNLIQRYFGGPEKQDKQQSPRPEEPEVYLKGEPTPFVYRLMDHYGFDLPYSMLRGRPAPPCPEIVDITPGPETDTFQQLPNDASQRKLLTNKADVQTVDFTEKK